jgi:hypothetical protein
LLPPAALTAIGCFAAHELDPAAAAEGAYLGRLVAAALVAVAALAPAPAAELGLGAALAVTAIWALPAGPGRGAAVAALLAAALAIASTRRLRRSPAAAVAGGGEDRARFVTAAALCFGWQVLLRGELLFAPGRAMRPWLALLALPLAAGAALALLWSRRGMLPALAAAGAAAVLAPGWTVATTLALVALAGGEVLIGTPVAPASGTGEAGGGGSGTRLPERSQAAARDREGAHALAEVDMAPAGRTEAEAGASRPARGQAVWRIGPAWRTWAIGPGSRAGARAAAGTAALLLPVAWEPRAGWAAALAGLALGRPGLAAALALPLAAWTRGASLAGLPLPGALGAHASWREGAAALALLVMLVPAAVPAAWRPRCRSLLAAAALLAFASPWLPDRSALAAPLALAALALPAAGAAAGLAAIWSTALLLGTALLASYPWLRQDPLGDALALLGTGAGPALAVAIGGAALLMVGAIELVLRRLPAATRLPAGQRASAKAGRLAAVAAGAAMFAAVVGPQLAAPGVALLGGGNAVLLDHGNPSWHTGVGPQRWRGLALQTSLIHGAGLAGGTPVARIRLIGTGTAPLELQLRAGDDTGEWAARRPDVAAIARLHPPRPWLAWVAGDFFGQRYRARLPLPRGASFARLEIDLAAGLPPDTGVALYQVELVQ